MGQSDIFQESIKGLLNNREHVEIALEAVPDFSHILVTVFYENLFYIAVYHLFIKGSEGMPQYGLL